MMAVVVAAAWPQQRWRRCGRARTSSTALAAPARHAWHPSTVCHDPHRLTLCQITGAAPLGANVLFSRGTALHVQHVFCGAGHALVHQRRVIREGGNAFCRCNMCSLCWARAAAALGASRWRSCGASTSATTSTAARSEPLGARAEASVRGSFSAGCCSVARKRCTCRSTAARLTSSHGRASDGGGLVHKTATLRARH